MQKTLSPYLVVLILAQLVTMALAVAYPYAISRWPLSPSLISFSRQLLDLFPAICLALFLAYRMARGCSFQLWPFVLTFFGGISGLLMLLTRLPLVLKYGILTVTYQVLLIAFCYFYSSALSYLSITFFCATCFLVFFDLYRLRDQLDRDYPWLAVLLIFLSFVQPWVAMLTIFVIYNSNGAFPIRLLYKYLIPIVVLIAAKRLSSRLLISDFLFGLPAAAIVPTAISILLCVVIAVMLFRDAPRAGLSRLLICASVIYSAPLSAMALLLCIQPKETIEVEQSISLSHE